MECEQSSNMADVDSVDGDDTEATSASKDKLFDPSVDMLVNDFDDERTLEEEETLAAGESEDPSAELSSLQKESNMPLEELLALYRYREMQENDSPIDEETEEISEAMEEQESELDAQEETSKLTALYDTIPDSDPDASRLLRFSRISEEEDEDYDYSPDEDEWRKTIMVGSDYQAVIPEGLCNYDDALPYENEDKLLWDPNPLEKHVIENFLKKAATFAKPAIPLGTHIRDDEQVLYLLQQCGHNVEEALRRIRLNVIPNSDTMSLWSEDECKNFESGVRCFGKNFHLIQQNKVRTRSVGELVQFYYLWKKSERHDIFANKIRLEKKKYTLHPGLTDFMDRFLEDQDGRDRSSSPNVQYSGSDNKNPTDMVQTSQKPPPEA